MVFLHINRILAWADWIAKRTWSWCWNGWEEERWWSCCAIMSVPPRSSCCPPPCLRLKTALKLRPRLSHQIINWSCRPRSLPKKERSKPDERFGFLSSFSYWYTLVTYMVVRLSLFACYNDNCHVLLLGWNGIITENNNNSDVMIFSRVKNKNYESRVKIKW